MSHVIEGTLDSGEGATAPNVRAWVIGITVLVALLGLFTPNPGLSVLAAVAAGVVVLLLWRPSEPAGLLYAIGFHWLQASALLMEANVRGTVLDSFEYQSRVAPATAISLLGVVVLALFIRLVIGPAAQVARTATHELAITRFSTGRLWLAWLVALAVHLASLQVAYIVPALTQPILAFELIRWVIAVLFGMVVFHRGKGYGLMGLMVVAELGVGSLGYFSEFKSIFVALLLGLLVSGGRHSRLRLPAIAVLAAVVLLLGIVWSAIKMDYRAFLNQGTGQQVVLVGVPERVAKLTELATSVDGGDMITGLELLAHRMGYVYYLGEVMDYVPRNLPHENGRLWYEAFERALVPRIINPEKSIIDDSERTSHYTGMRVAGAEQGTSISLGYFAESYVDFGPWLMFLSLAGWGVLLGLAYRILVRTEPMLLGSIAASVLVAYQASTLEQSNLKMVAATWLGFLVLWLATKFGGRRLLALVEVPHRVST